jgi:hypothetical protein
LIGWFYLDHQEAVPMLCYGGRTGKVRVDHLEEPGLAPSCNVCVLLKGGPARFRKATEHW